MFFNYICTLQIMNKLETNSKWFAVVNPEAGSGKGRTDWPIIMKHLSDKGVNFDYALTQKKYHAVELTVSAVNNGYRRIIAVGGDGTLNEVVNGLFIQQMVSPSEVILGVIGVGTGNDWQRMYALPDSYEGKVDTLIHTRCFLQDVGKVEYFESRYPQSRFFANAAGVGFDAQVAQNTNRLKESGRRGKLLYIFSLVKTLFSYKSTIVSVDVDNEKIGGKIFSITLGIGRYNGGGMMQVPNALADDGLFDVTVIRHVNRREVLRNAYRLYNGTILRHPKISGHQGKKVVISSKPPVNLEVDGESLGTSPFAFSIIPKAIKVVVGAGFKEMDISSN